MDTTQTTITTGATPQFTIDSIGARQLQVVLPSQYFKAHSQQTPERRLMAAVLQDAIDCIGKHRSADDFRSRRVFWEAKRWFLNDERDWPFSFEHICDVLNLDSSAVRRALRLTSARPILPGGKLVSPPLSA